MYENSVNYFVTCAILIDSDECLWFLKGSEFYSDEIESIDSRINTISEEVKIKDNANTLK